VEREDEEIPHYILTLAALEQPAARPA